MAIQLTRQQQHDLDSAEASPPEVVDPRTNVSYVLIPSADYEEIREFIEEEKQQRVIRRVALRNAVGRMDEVS